MKIQPKVDMYIFPVQQEALLKHYYFKLGIMLGAEDIKMNKTYLCSS